MSDIDSPPVRRDGFVYRMIICIFTGFTSGIPLYFIYSLLPAWLRSEGISLTDIGLLALVGIPYTWKFLWAPAMDAFFCQRFGRRRSWMLATQIPLLFLLAAYNSLTNPQQDLPSIMFLAVCVAFFSASQDIVIDAYRREILSDEELGLGNSIHVNAYRLSSLIPGSLALFLADRMAWSDVFLITALFMLPGLFLTLFLAQEPPLAVKSARSLRDTVILPFKEFFQRQGLENALWILAFIFFYKLGDSMATALASPFYLDMGFSKTHIALVVKHASLWPMLIAALAGGVLMMKWGIHRSLWIFGIVQIATIPGFAWLAALGPFDTVGLRELWYLGGVVAAEYIGVGLGTAAFVAFIAKTTHPLYTATQLALLTSLAAMPRTFLNASTGFLIDWLGYVNFFILCFMAAIPGMLMLFKVAPWQHK